MGTPPNLNDETVSTGAVVEELRGRLQHGLADDILWGTPKGQVLQGYSPLNSIHRQMMPARVAPASNFEVVQTIAPAPGVIVAHIGRNSLDGGFSEMAMYVLVERDGRWWPAAAQNTPIIDTLPTR